MSDKATVVTVATPSGRDFKASHHLQTEKAQPRRIVSSLPGAVSHVAEARYWSEKYGLDGGNVGNSDKKVTIRFATNKMYAHPRKCRLQAGTAASVAQVTFGPATGKVTPLAVACGPRVQIWGNSVQSDLHRKLSRKDTSHREFDNISTPDKQVVTGGQLALCVDYRLDGRLLAVGTDQGSIRIADVTSRAILITFTPNTTSKLARLPIRSVQWMKRQYDNTLMSAGDDGILRVWSLKHKGVGGGSQYSNNTSNAILECSGHGDAIRSCSLWQASVSERSKYPYGSVACTGSYDHTLRLWNLDNLELSDSPNNNVQDRCIATLSHGAPVECVITMPATSAPVWFVSAGGTQVKVWHPFTGECIFTLKAPHCKTITSLLHVVRDNQATDERFDRLMTAGLDGYIRWYSWNTHGQDLSCQLLHGINIGAPLSTLAVNESGTRIAMGTIDGNVLVRQRGPSITSKKRERPRANTVAYLQRGSLEEPMDGDYVMVNARKKKQLQEYDVALRQFRYGDALDEALASRRPPAVMAVLEELGKRQGLALALQHRDEESLEPIMSFVARYLVKPSMASILIGVCNVLIDLYGDMVSQSEVIDELFNKLKRQVSKEFQAQKKLFVVAGQLDALLTAIGEDNEE